MSAVATMVESNLKTRFKSLLPSGVAINGPAPCDPQVHDKRLYSAVMLHGTLGLGEAYMKGWWDCEKLDVFFTHLLQVGLLERMRFHPSMLRVRLREKFVNEQRRSRADDIAKHHYNPSSSIILSFLDPLNQYTCGYWKDVDDLDSAQQAKLDLICRKLKLKSGDKVLDIGCGWGGFARYAAEKYGCHVTGVSVSNEQIEVAKNFCRGLPVDIVYADYRNLPTMFPRGFNKILICGMIEHVGYKNYRTVMQAVSRCLEPEGLFLLHTIGKGSDDLQVCEPWILKYIFPGGMIPTPTRIAKAAEGLLDPVDFHEFGEYYDPTLMAWTSRLEKNWHLFAKDHTESEHRMWRYYLLSAAAHFRARKVNLWQYVFRLKGARGYVSVR